MSTVYCCFVEKDFFIIFVPCPDLLHNSLCVTISRVEDFETGTCWMGVFQYFGGNGSTYAPCGLLTAISMILSLIMIFCDCLATRVGDDGDTLPCYLVTAIVLSSVNLVLCLTTLVYGAEQYGEAKTSGVDILETTKTSVEVALAINFVCWVFQHVFKMKYFNVEMPYSFAGFCALSLHRVPGAYMYMQGNLECRVRQWKLPSLI